MIEFFSGKGGISEQYCRQLRWSIWEGRGLARTGLMRLRTESLTPQLKRE
jgi:hypothetical protein